MLFDYKGIQTIFALNCNRTISVSNLTVFHRFKEILVIIINF
jgi:hypothetical protein